MRSWPSLTAEAVCMARALEHRRRDRLVDDPHAVGFLRAPARAAVRVAAASGRLGNLAERGLDPGLVAAIGARHGWIDAQVQDALVPGGQLLLLGAGYDSRPWRLNLSEVRCVALDHPATARRKARLVARQGLPEDAREVVTADLAEESLDDALDRTSLRHDAPIVIVWEGVSMYLDEATIRRTLGILRQRYADCVLLLDVWSEKQDGVLLDMAEQAGRGGLAVLGEPFRFSCEPRNIRSFFASNAWSVEIHTDVDAHARLHAGRRAYPRLQLVRARPEPLPG